ncbi:MAG: hypothetical protein OXR07_07435 [Nitrospira sp.]|nr:hypothetical protein [Nitrospira sp.]MDD9860500.1 hypothetical protein [Nitrospira sp.]
MIDDWLCDEVKKTTGLDLNDGQIEEILERTMSIARHRART